VADPVPEASSASVPASVAAGRGAGAATSRWPGKALEERRSSRCSSWTSAFASPSAAEEEAVGVFSCSSGTEDSGAPGFSGSTAAVSAAGSPAVEPVVGWAVVGSAAGPEPDVGAAPGAAAADAAPAPTTPAVAAAAPDAAAPDAAAPRVPLASVLVSVSVSAPAFVPVPGARETVSSSGRSPSAGNGSIDSVAGSAARPGPVGSDVGASSPAETGAAEPALTEVSRPGTTTGAAGAASRAEATAASGDAPRPA